MAGMIPIVVIGASAGGVEAVSHLVRGLPTDFPGAVFVTMHFPPHSTSVLPRILERAGKLPASHPEHGMRIERGHVYVSVPDFHLMLAGRRVYLVRGPTENGTRPAVDPMFRSAAVSHGSHVIGVVLTGNLDDGTSGLLAIKRRGGRTIVQDPTDALFPSMPNSAIEHVNVDHILPLAQIAPKIVALANHLANSNSRKGSEADMPDDAHDETRFAELDLRVIEDVADHPGSPSQFGCPDCGGVLWEINDGEMVRYRCRVGHAWTSDALFSSQTNQLDQALWTALRALEENVSMSEGMARRARERNATRLAERYEQSADEARERARIIRGALVSGMPEAREAAKAEATKPGG